MSALAQNRQARFDFELLETIEAGIELLGFEVKAARAGMVSFKGAYVTVAPGGAVIKGMRISPYQPKNVPDDYDPTRPRRLLLHKKELSRLVGREKEKGLTVIPLSMYSKGRTIKVEVAIARGKKKRDKRELLKKRDAQREMERSMKGEGHT